MVISETGGAANEHCEWEERLQLNPLIALKAFHTIYPVTRDGGGACVPECVCRWVGGRRKRDNSEKTYCKNRRKKCTMVLHLRSPNQTLSHTYTRTSYSAEASSILNCSQSFQTLLKSHKPHARTHERTHTHTLSPDHSFQHTRIHIYSRSSLCATQHCAVHCSGVLLHGPALIKVKSLLSVLSSIKATAES